MKITLENIGQIKKTEIDLSKDLIVLCGGNNTGKTYAAYTVYGLFKFVETLAKSVNLKSITENLQHLPSAGTITLNLQEIFLAEKKTIINVLTSQYVDFLPTVFASPKDFFNDAKLDIIFDEKNVLMDIFTSEIEGNITFGENIMVIFEKKKRDHWYILH